MNEKRHESVQTAIKTVKELLSLNLSIPDYQRPYKWGVKHVEQLLHDLMAIHHDKSGSRYRLGTIVLYQNRKSDRALEIVDGQQRIVTLLLILKAALDLSERKPVEVEAEVEKKLQKFEFPHHISQENLSKNYQVIQRFVRGPDFDVESVHTILNGCDVVCFTLSDLSEAFQFFDSQNSRGKDLEPHDLLKAYHLREFSKEGAVNKKHAVDEWEAQESNALAKLFGDYLYRIRQWVYGKSALNFMKDDVDLFKGINLAKNEPPPLAQPWILLNKYLREVRQPFPFQLDQPIINGRRFFEMVAHYQQLQNKVTVCTFDDDPLTNRAIDVLSCLNSYKKRYRIGDIYIRILFDCALMFFIDKFGTALLSTAIEKIFIWAYSCRLRAYSVRLTSMDNYARGKHQHNCINLFKHFHESMTANEALHFKMTVLKKENTYDGGRNLGDYVFVDENYSSGQNPDDKKPNMVDLFADLGYFLEEPVKNG